MNYYINTDKLIGAAKSLKNTSACLKISFVHNTIQVRCYFSNIFNTPSFQLILFTGNYYYLKPINITEKRINPKDKYLEYIPASILSKILDDKGSLNTFYSELCNVINNYDNDVTFANYTKDNDYLKAKTYMSKNNIKEIHPFVSHLANTPMSDKQFERLHLSLGISKDLLNKIRDKFTIHTTMDSTKAKDLIILIKDQLH